MKSIGKLAWLFVQVAAVAALLTAGVPKLAAQSVPPVIGDQGISFNPPPCDFNDNFYQENGIDTTQLDTAPAQRFGLFRQFGPPARQPNQANWVVDNTCSAREPIRTNVRILAATGGYPDDGTGTATEFISILAFVTSQSFFETSFTSPSCDPNIPTLTCVKITDVGGVGLNPRNISGPGFFGETDGSMEFIVENFEAYPALKQRLPSGTFAPVPCGSLDTAANNPINIGLNAPNGPINLPSNPPGNCFPVTSVATPQLRQDWRFATNRNAIDGSDNNNVQGSGPNAMIVNNTPFGYFCDDTLGMWINTYWWFTQDPGTNGPCTSIYNMLGQMHGFSLDGTPIVLTANELNNDLEANGCAAEGKLDFGGADGGAVWLVCPAIPDPRSGAIAPDAFLDTVRRPDGFPLDIRFNLNFACLQIFGAFCKELSASQASSSTVTSAAASN